MPDKTADHQISIFLVSAMFKFFVCFFFNKNNEYLWIGTLHFIVLWKNHIP